MKYMIEFYLDEKPLFNTDLFNSENQCLKWFNKCDYCYENITAMLITYDNAGGIIKQEQLQVGVYY